MKVIINQLFIYINILIYLYIVSSISAYSISKVELVESSYYSKYNDQLNGCNTTIIVKVENDQSSQSIDTLDSADSSIIFDSSTLLLKSGNYTVIKLSGLNSNLNSKSLSLVGKSSLNSTISESFNNILVLSCIEPPTNLGVKINYSTLIPIDRSNENLFEVAILLQNVLSGINLDFKITSINSAFSLEYEKLSTLQYILKFKISNSTNLTDDQVIQVTPINKLSTNSNTGNFTSFTIKPTIKRSLNNQYSNIKFYSWINSNEKYGYYLFNVKNDNSFVPTVGYSSDAQQIDESLKSAIKTAYPISGNQTDLTFIGYFKAPVYTPNSLQDVTTFFSSNENKSQIHTLYPISPSFNTNFYGSLKDNYNKVQSSNGPYFIETTFGITSEETGNDVQFPSSISSQTILDWKFQDDYNPYFAISSYNPSMLTFKREMYAPMYFFQKYANTPYSRLASIYNNQYQDITINGINSNLNQNYDITPPVINDITLISHDSYGYIIRFQLAQDSSPFTFSYLRINGLLVTALNLASNGIVEKLVNESFVISMRQSFSILVCDQIYNCDEKTYYPNTFGLLNYNPFNSLTLPSYKIINIFDIQSFYFQINTMNLNSNANRVNKVYIKVNTISKYYPIYFKLSKSSKQLNQFKYNSDLGLYECSIKIPNNYINGKLNYFVVLNDKEYSYSSLYSIIGSTNSTLNIQSTTIDISPPFVTQIEAFPSRNVELSDQLNSFGWDIRIEDQVNGFDYGQIQVTSTINPIAVKNISFNAQDLVDGVFKISIASSLNCTTQTYSICSIYLRDKEGYESYSAGSSISALFQVAGIEDSNIYVACASEYYESTSPKITEFSITPSITEYDYSSPPSLYIEYTINDPSLSNIAITKSYPIIYYQDDFGNLHIACNSSNTFPAGNSNTTHLGLACEPIQPPYGFGYPGYLTLSVYSIVDDYLNVVGIGGYTLNSNFGVDTILSTKISLSNPVISSSNSGLYTNGGKNILITLYGTNFGLDQTSLSVTVNNVPDSNLVDDNLISETPFKSRKILGSNDLPHQVVLFTNSEIVLDVDVSSTVSNNVAITVSLGSDISNTYNYILPNYVQTGSSSSSVDNNSSNETTVGNCIELNNCGGPTQGICIAQNTCTCLYGWVGVSCTSKPLEGVSIAVDTEKPSASLTQEGGLYKLLSLINLYQLREIDIKGGVVNSYNLTKKWDNGGKLDTKSPEQYKFSNVINNSTTISSIISIYLQQSSFSFGDTNYQINPNSIKFTVNITSYQFQSQFNTLELIIQAKLNSEQSKGICSKKSTTLTSDSDLLSIQLNEKSLYCRFIKTALVDGKNKVNVEHINKNNEFNVTLESNSGTYFYAIQLPKYQDYILIDPDFSLLLESKTLSGGDTNTTCALGKSKSKLSGGAIAGIVIAGVAVIVVVAIIIGTLLFGKLRFSNFTMSIRGWNSKRRSKRSSSSYNLKTIK